MQKKEKVAGATLLGRLAREQIEKLNQMTASPGIPDKGGHQKCPASLWALFREGFLREQSRMNQKGRNS